MIRKLALIGITLLWVSGTTGCLLDPEKTPPDDGGGVIPPTAKFENLSEEWHVLNNLELAYLQRNTDEIEKLMDDAFTFFFSDGDVGGSIPVQWNREAEIAASKGMLTGSNRLLSVDVDIQFDKNTLQWINVNPDPQGPFAGEIWKTTTVTYIFTLRVDEDLTFITAGAPRVQFTIREADVNGTMVWRLIEWRDLANS